MTTDKEIKAKWNAIFPKEMDDDKAAIRLWRECEAKTKQTCKRVIETEGYDASPEVRKIMDEQYEKGITKGKYLQQQEYVPLIRIAEERSRVSAFAEIREGKAFKQVEKALIEKGRASAVPKCGCGQDAAIVMCINHHENVLIYERNRSRAEGIEAVEKELNNRGFSKGSCSRDECILEEAIAAARRKSP